MTRSSALGFALVLPLWVVASSGAAKTPAEGCAGAKLNASGNIGAAMLGCHANAARHGVTVHSACIAKAKTKLRSRFANLDGRGGCARTGDVSGIAAILDSSVGAFVTALRPTTTANRCAALKLKATGKKAQAKLRCYGKAERGGGSGGDADCLTHAEAQFGAAFTAAEHSPTCLTMNDAADVESAVDDFVGKVVAAIPSETTASSSTSTTTSVAGPSTTSTTSPTCVEHGENWCGGADSPCCGTDVCEGFVCGGEHGGSVCVSCINPYDQPDWCNYSGCRKDSDCCTAGYKCFFPSTFGLCAAPDACIPAGQSCYPEYPGGFPCCNGGVCPANRICP